MVVVKEILLINILLGVFYSVVLQEDKRKTKRILVFGGNGFIGSETVQRLIERGDSVTMVNRGNSYFDSEERIKPRVTDHFKCDREQMLTLECPQILHSGRYDAVIDFSSYNHKQIEQTTNILQDRVDLYVYISTGSVYEVCDKKHKGRTKEDDAVRPKNRGKQLKLKKQEMYGHEKLSCEEELQLQRQTGGFPFVVLRLPDVIGPRDNSFRFWTYQLWVKTHKAIAHPIHLPDSVADTKFSLVHVDDVANAIIAILDAGKKVHDQAINLAFEEEFTLRKLIEAIAIKENVELDSLQFLTDDKLAWYTLPTVSKGPLDTRKARDLIAWNPMTWEDALDGLSKFYNDAMTDKKWIKEREMVLADFFEFVVQEQYYQAALTELKRIYGKDIFDGVDFGWKDYTPAIEGTSRDQSSSISEESTSEVNTTDLGESSSYAENDEKPKKKNKVLHQERAMDKSKEKKVGDDGRETEIDSNDMKNEPTKHEEL